MPPESAKPAVVLLTDEQHLAAAIKLRGDTQAQYEAIIPLKCKAESRFYALDAEFKRLSDLRGETKWKCFFIERDQRMFAE